MRERNAAMAGRLKNGEGGIQTHGTLSGSHTFQACALDQAMRPLPVEGRILAYLMEFLKTNLGKGVSA